MKRLRGRSRSATRGPAAAGSLSCLPRSLLCHAWSPSSPRVADTSPAFVTSLLAPRSTTVDDINHVDRRASGVVEQSRMNRVRSGAALPGGNGQQHYGQFIATLLRERAAIRDGVLPAAVDQPKPRVNKPPSAIRQLQRKQTNRVGNKPTINGFDRNSLRVEATEVNAKPASDETSLLKSDGGRFSSAIDDNDVTTTDVLRRRPEKKLDTCLSLAETIEADATSGTSAWKIDTMECSPRQRRRRHRRQRDRCRNGAVKTSCRTDGQSERRVTAESQAKVVHLDYKSSKNSVAVTFDGTKPEIATRVNGTMSQRRQGSSDRLNESSAFRNWFDGCNTEAPRARVRVESEPLFQTRTAVVDRHQDRGSLSETFTACNGFEGLDTVTSHSPAVERVGYELSRKNRATLSNDSRSGLPIHLNKEEVDKWHEEGVFGSNDDTSTIQFIDCDTQRVEWETEQQVFIGKEDHRTMADREREMTASCPSPRAVSQHCIRRHERGKCVCADAQNCFYTVRCRSSTKTGEWAELGRLRRHCRSQPTLFHPPAYQRSSAFYQTFGQLTRDRTHRSQLLQTCRCSISYPKTALLYMVESEDANSDDRRPRQSTPHGLVQSDVPNATSIAPQRTPQLPYDVSHPSVCRRQQRANSCVILPPINAGKVVRGRSGSREGRLPIDRISVDRHVAGRCRQTGRCGGRTSRCLLRTEFILTRLQTSDQTTTFLFTRRKTNNCDQIVTCDSDVLNSSLCRCCTCSTSDVRGCNDDVISDSKQNAHLTRNCTAVESIAVSPPSSVISIRSFNASQVRLSFDNDAVRMATVDDVTSGDADDVSQSLMMYEFAEVMSIFRYFADDLLPTTGRVLSVVPYNAGRRQEGGSTSRALVRPGVTYSGAVVPYATPPSVCVPLPLMTWTWNHDDAAGSRPRAKNDDVIHIPYVSACTAVDLEPSIDNFTLIIASSYNV